MKYWQFLVCIAFTWVGFVSAISFMESWLKFHAQGVTLPIGLSIGRLIFGTLNKIEWVLAFSSLFLLLFGEDYKVRASIFLFLPIIILLLQTIWLLPAMDSRAALHISGAAVPPSNLHFYYVGGELIKVLSLIIFGIKIFK